MAKSELRTDRFPNFVQELQENFSEEFVGFGFLIAGGLVALNLRFADGVPWIAQMTGWTAPLVALALLTVGCVLIFGRRAGYWSAEALVGAECLLLSLQAGAFVLRHDTFDWTIRATGEFGGVLGWGIGGLLVASLGQTAAAAVVVLLGVVGTALLLRYTPLIYLVAYAAQLAPVAAIYTRWAWRCLLGKPFMRRPRRLVLPSLPSWTQPVMPRTQNFVTPYDDEDSDGWEDGADDVPVNYGDPALAHLLRAPQPKSRPATQARAKTLRPARRPSSLPPLDILSQDTGIFGAQEVRMMEQAIEQTLEEFNVPVRVVHVESGPTVTQFGVEPLYLERSGQRRKVRVNRIVTLAEDLALALAAPAIRIEAPVPGRPYVGIEVPNADKSLVALRGILESAEMRKSTGKLMLALGRDTSGAPVTLDLTRAPHLLIAGSTGSGKSVCINTIISSLLMQHGPESLRFVMVDPKMVELPGYNGIPHLEGKVITDVEQVMGALTWLLLQLDDRYQLFREVGVRNIDSYNELARQSRSKGHSGERLEHMPYIVLIIDELADLMMTAADDVERQICRLAQMARATGIHLILATQRPSTDVVTGLIKANFPSRIAFAVSSLVDSRVILDEPGAERLLGQGDMLLLHPGSAKLHRVQGCFVSDDEINQLTQFWKLRLDPNEQSKVAPWNGLMDRMEQEDELILDAMDLLRGMKTCSTSMLQRKLRVGYPKAARLMEDLEARGVVGPDLGGGQGRAVLLKKENEEEAEAEEEYL
jgi:DNA segregation ATPase FtsK/SpoIIIE, S-DNA-T family